MAIIPVNGTFTAGTIPAGSNTYNQRPLLVRLDNSYADGRGGADAANFLIGHGNVTNYNSGTQTFDLEFQANLLYPARNNGTTGGAAPAVGATTSLYSATGVPDGDNSTGFQAAVGLANGGYIAAISTGDTIAEASFALHFVSSRGTVQQVVDPSPVNGNAHFVNGIVELDNGNYLVTWTDISLDLSNNPVDANVMAIVIDATGAAVGSAFQINSSTTDGYGGGSIAQAGGGFVAVFEHVVIGIGGIETTEIMARRLDANGVPTGSDFVIGTVAAGIQVDNIQIVSNALGGFFAFWSESDPIPVGGGTVNWSVRQSFQTAATSGNNAFTVASGSATLDANGLVTGGVQLQNMDATDLANGGAAVVVQTFTFTGGLTAQNAYLFNRGNIPNDQAGNATGAAGTPGTPILVSGGFNNGAFELAEDGRIVHVGTNGSDIVAEYLTFNNNTTTVGSTAADDVLYGDLGVDDQMFGGAGNDTLHGLSGFDFLQGGAGNDILNGGDDDDTADYSDANGTGRPIANFTVTLTDTADGNGNLLGTAISDAGESDTLISIERIRGGNGNDIITGNSLNNILRGNLGNDTIDGGAGTDSAEYSNASGAVTVTLTNVVSGISGGSSTGAAGNDTLINIENIFGGNSADTLTGNSSDNLIRGGQGNDTINGAGGNDTADYRNAQGSVTVTLTDSVDGLGNLLGSSTGAEGNDLLLNIERIRGGRFNDTLTGNALSNTLRGMDGDDTLDGGAGYDWAAYMDATGSVTVTLTNVVGGISGGSSTGAGGNDTLINIEYLIGSAFDDTLNGNTSSNRLRGGLGADILNGGGGTDFADYGAATAGLTIRLGVPGDNTGEAAGDTYISIEGVYGSEFNDLIGGNSANNTLYGLGGDDFLGGGVGNDYLDGGNGVDLASYRYYDGSVVPLVVSLENTALNTGDAVGDTYVRIEGIRGSAYNDTLYGNTSDNVLAGAEGADSLNGGGGNDTASYLSDDSGNGVVANLANAAVNTGHAAGDSYNSIENLRGSLFNDALTGDGADNSLNGDAGDDTLAGGLGNDTLLGGNGNDIADYSAATGAIVVTLRDTVTTSGLYGTTTGADGVDRLYSVENAIGGAGNDRLTGNAVDNVLSGGAGNDIISAFGGNDTLLGGDGVDSLTGGDGNDTLTGNDGNDTLAGGIGDDVLWGDDADLLGDGDDFLDGGAGADAMHGGMGNDRYIVDDAGDTADETDGYGGDAGGFDQVSASVSFTLGDFIENLTLTGADDINGTGNSLANRIAGNDGANTLDGGAGTDVLTGGLGNDRLIGGNGIDTLWGGADADVFVLQNIAVHRDSLRDFQSGLDSIEISAALFGGGLAAGSLAANQFAANGTGNATATDQRFIYNTSNGALYFDADGNGAGARVQIATVSGALAVTDFTIV